jgi:SAM-dependent methyltransferase
LEKKESVAAGLEVFYLIMDLKETYNKIAEDLTKSHAYHDSVWWREGTDKFVSFLKPGAMVLDVGCGGGIASKYLIEKGFSVTGIDFSEKMIEIAKRDVPRGKFFVMDMRDVDLLKENFDGLYVKASILHLSKKEVPNFMLKLKERIKQGGFIYVAVKGANPGQEEEQVKVEDDYGYSYERFFSFFFESEMEKYFADAGLKVIWKKIAKTGRTNWIEVIGQRI